jgi:hypothetical protein
MNGVTELYSLPCKSAGNTTYCRVYASMHEILLSWIFDIECKDTRPPKRTPKRDRYGFDRKMNIQGTGKSSIPTAKNVCD